MQDKEVKENIYKCSRCGLCSEVCPIFKELKKESCATRGKLMQILGLKKGDLKPSGKILQNIDLCLNCEKCKLNCPSGVDTTGVFCAERKLNTLGKFLTSDFIFNLKLSALNAFSIFKKTPKYEKHSKVLYFEGCISKKLKNQFAIPNAKIQNGNFKCCGLPYLSKGRLDIYKDMAKFNEKIIDSAETVIFDCATCFNSVYNYPFKNPKNKEKLVFCADIYKNINLQSKKNLKVGYHMPCHLKSAYHGTGKSIKDIENILRNIKNLNCVRLKNYDDCCGFGGDFFIRHPKIAYSLSLKKAKNIIESRVDIVLTSCPTCLWSLKFSLFMYKILNKGAKIPRAMDMAEFLNTQCNILNTRQLQEKEPQKEKGLVKI